MGKYNILGSIHATPGQNLISGLLGEKQQIGILERNYPQMEAILKDALEPNEYELLRLGLGIRCKRLYQKEIAARFDIAESTLSTTFKRIFEKLQKHSVKEQLVALMSTADELATEIENLEQENKQLKNAVKQLKENSSKAKENKALKCQLDAKKQVLAGVEAENKKLERKVKRLEYDYAQSLKERDTLAAEINQAHAKIVELNQQCAFERARADIAKESFDKAFERFAIRMHQTLDDFVEIEKTDFLVQLASATARTMTLEDLHLSDATLKLLRSRTIYTIKDLCNQTKVGLVSMVGKDNAIIIERQLNEAGYFLKAS